MAIAFSVFPIYRSHKYSIIPIFMCNTWYQLWLYGPEQLCSANIAPTSSRALVEVTKSIAPFCYFPSVLELSKHWLAIEYNFHIWQVSLQFSHCNTYRIWMWVLRICKACLHNHKYPNSEVNKQNFSKTSPWGLVCMASHRMIWCCLEINWLAPGQNGPYLAEEFFTCNYLNENSCIQ